MVTIFILMELLRNFIKRTPVITESHYLAQLSERPGKQALINIGYK
jgi:hypothetical protein